LAPDWLVPAVGIAGSLIVAASNYAVQRWRYRIDHISGAIHRVTLVVRETADLATRYWLLDGRDPDQREIVGRLEYDLVGLQSRLQQIVVTLGFQDAALELGGVNMVIADFYDRISGGSFSVRGRPPDLPRASDVQGQAATLEGSLWRALAARSNHWF
jgi:hypothetical protein